MITKRIFLLCLVVFTLVFSIEVFGSIYPFKFKPGSEPDGFRGIKWGTEISTLKDMVLIPGKASEKYQLESNYKRNSDELKIGSARIEKVIYVFWNNKFCMANVYVRGYNNWEKLRKECFSMFGQLDNKSDMIERDVKKYGLSRGIVEGIHTKSEKDIERMSDYETHTWTGDIAKVSISFSRSKKEGNLTIMSVSIDKEIELFVRQKEIKEKGF